MNRFQKINTLDLLKKAESGGGGYTLCIFGAGKFGTETLYRDLKNKFKINPNYFCDNSPEKWGRNFTEDNILCLSPQELAAKAKENKLVVFSGIAYRYSTIKRNLEKLGIKNVICGEWVVHDLRNLYDLEFYRPCAINDLIRLGKDYDGGYIISKSQIEKTEILLSFGVNYEWSFEEDFADENKNTKIYAYDYSVDETKADERFHNFFNNEKAKFVKKYIGNENNNIYTNFDNIFAEISAASPINALSVFVKMDVEGGEYSCLPDLPVYFDKINGLTVEFHNLFKPEQFQNIMCIFMEYFYIVHIHANICGGYIAGTNLPNLLEISFINKKMLPSIPEKSKLQYPINDLDFPNSPYLPDISLFKSVK